MKLSNLFKKNTSKKDSVVIKVDKKLLEKIVGGGGDGTVDTTNPTNLIKFGSPKLEGGKEGLA